MERTPRWPHPAHAAGCLLVLALAIVAAGMSAPPVDARTVAKAGPATGKRCKSVQVADTRIRVTIDRGRVTCRTARTVVRRYFRGEGVRHGGPSQAETYYKIGRWRCGPGAGGVGCIRKGTTWTSARDRVLGEAVAGRASSASRSATVPQVRTTLSNVILAERAVDSYPLGSVVRCRAANRGVSCEFTTGTLDGDVKWRGRARFTGFDPAREWTFGSERYRYRLSGTKTLCSVTGRRDCEQRRFTWSGRGCASVTNGVDGDGEGAAVSIHAFGRTCSQARRVARRCLLGDRTGHEVHAAPFSARSNPATRRPAGVVRPRRRRRLWLVS